MDCELLIDAIIGAGFAHTKHACLMVQVGFATFTGNQHNPAWEWNKSKLEELPQDDLASLYYNIKDNQNKS